MYNTYQYVKIWIENDIEYEVAIKFYVTFKFYSYKLLDIF